ncbi:MAG: SDR family oxidoreductase [Bacilli bacterium]|nr:SDR family oxidoreductase [Bacilli bacterium]
MNCDYNFGNQCYNYYGDTGIKSLKYEILAPEQEQIKQPGMEYLMTPKPIFDNPNYIGSGKLKNKVAIITGADSGLGRAAAVAFVKEGAKVVIPYYDEHRDAMETKEYIEMLGGECELLSGDISDKNFCKHIVDFTLQRFGKIDILVNNAGVQYQQDTLECISDEQFDRTMKVNIYGMFYLTKEVLPHLKSGSSIINLSSVTTFYGEPQLIDYVTTKGAIIGFTRSLARNLALKNIRVNAIAPGFFWTPLQPACWVKEKIPSLGSDAAMARGAMPYELAPTFVFLASDDSSYVTGQVIHNNGGQVMG